MSENKMVNFSIIFIFIVVLANVLKTFQSFLRPFALAIIFTFLIMPLVRYSKSKKIPIWAMAILLILFIGSLVVGLGSMLTKESENVDLSIEDRIQGTLTSLPTKIAFQGNEIDLMSFVEPDKIGKFITSLLTSVLSGIGAIFSEIFLAIIFALFLLPSYNKIIGQFKSDLTKGGSRKIDSVISETEKSIRDYLYTKTLVSLGTALCSTLILYIFKVDFIVIIALLIFSLNFIPNIGSFIAVGVAIVVYIVGSGFGWGLVVFAVLLILVQLVFGNVVEPKFAGNQLKLSPIIILLSLFIWYWIWGIGGMILAIPLTSMLKIILVHVDKKYEKFFS